jgi:hypothetical protein
LDVNRYTPPRLVAGLVVLDEKIQAGVAVDIAPHAVDVVGVVLGVVEFNQDGGRLDAVAVGLAAIGASGPGEACSASSWNSRGPVAVR